MDQIVTSALCFTFLKLPAHARTHTHTHLFSRVEVCVALNTFAVFQISTVMQQPCQITVCVLSVLFNPSQNQHRDSVFSQLFVLQSNVWWACQCICSATAHVPPALALDYVEPWVVVACQALQPNTTHAGIKITVASEAVYYQPSILPANIKSATESSWILFTSYLS